MGWFILVMVLLLGLGALALFVGGKKKPNYQEIEPVRKTVRDLLEKKEKESNERIEALDSEEKVKEFNEKIRRFE